MTTNLERLDVVQIFSSVNGNAKTWEDYCTIHDDDDMNRAISMVTREPLTYRVFGRRIVDGSPVYACVFGQAEVAEGADSMQQHPVCEWRCSVRVIESQYWTLNSLGIYCMNFANYEEKCRNATDASLVYVMKDAREAMLANPEGVKAGYYADEISMAGMELNRRRALLMLNSPYYKTGGSHNPLCPPSKH